jgi:phage shock protein E
MKRSLLVALVLAFVMLNAQAAESDQKPDAPKGQARSATNFNNVDVKQFEKLRSEKNTVVLDVRTPKEYAAGHMPGAVNIDVNSGDFEKRVKGLDPSKTYLVHCGVGVRSAKACDKLSKLNFSHLYNLEGGFSAWTKAGNKPQR